jgi:Ca2+-transporting ATPase
MMALSHVWETLDGASFVVSAKGAPEAIADLCHLSLPEKEPLQEVTETMARDGLRVLGVAKALFGKQKLPLSQHDFDFKFVGLIGLADPVRPAVPDAIRECYAAGMRVVMMTGDYPSTAQNIARQIGLKDPDVVITGTALEKMSFEDLREKIKFVNIFSRVVPEQKLLIVSALKANGEIVAMTGDGVNDAPALKAAHIGIAMGARGTDVARESADLVLVDDDFSSIVESVRTGRRIYDNLRKAMAYIISVHVPIAGVSLIPVLLGWPIVLFPAHIVFLELIIDPACSIVFESEPPEKNIMRRPPRPAGEPLFGKKLLWLSLLQGLFSLAVVMAVFRVALVLRQGEEGARALAFITLVVSNICLILTNRSWSRSIIASLKACNRALAAVLTGVILALFLTMYTSFLRRVFHFGMMHPPDFLICLSAGLLSVLWFEFLKYLFQKKQIDLLKE